MKLRLPEPGEGWPVMSQSIADVYYVKPWFCTSCDRFHGTRRKKKEIKAMLNEMEQQIEDVRRVMGEG